MGLAATTTGWSTGRGLWSGSFGLSSGSGLVGGSGTDPGAAAYFAAVTAAGGTISPARQVLYNNFFTSMRAAGLLTLFDRLWIFAAANAATAKIDLVALQTATPINGPTFTVDRGYTGDGLSSYLDSGFIASSGGVNCVLNSTTLHFYCNTNAAINADSIGGQGAANTLTFMDIHQADGTTQGAIANAGVAVNVAAADSLGLFSLARTAANLTTAYKRGASIGTGATASAAIINVSSFILGFNNNGAPLVTETRRCASVAYSAGLNGSQEVAYNTILETFLTGVGASV